MVSKDIVDHAFKEMKRWYVEQEKAWKAFVKAREEYIERHKFQHWLVGAMAFSNEAPGKLLLADVVSARDMVNMHANVLNATLNYERASMEQQEI